MTTEELRAASETVLRCVKKTETDLGPRYERNDQSGMGLKEAWELASHYLATHRPDDDEPVTEEWLLDIGFARDADVFRRWLFVDVGNGYSLARLRIGESMCHYPGEWFVTYGTQWIPRVETRRQVRRLCEDLGIELKEA